MSVTAPLAWMVARELAGDLSSPTFKELRRVLGAVGVGIFLVIVSIARHQVWTIAVPLMVAAIAGISVGAAVGWMTQAPEDRDRR
ncbi:hypothetical protein ACWGLC_17420 [Dietzia sp. NPDC055877]